MDASPPKSPILTPSRSLYVLWILSIVLVITGSLLPATSPVIRGRKTARQPESAALLRLQLAGPAGAPGHQKLVPGRAFEIRDMFINGAGVLTGIAIGIPLGFTQQ
jgi:hypothetical protein